MIYSTDFSDATLSDNLRAFRACGLDWQLKETVLINNHDGPFHLLLVNFLVLVWGKSESAILGCSGGRLRRACVGEL